MALISNIKFYLILIVFFNFYYSQIDTSQTTVTENKEPNYIPAYDFNLQALQSEDSLLTLSSLKGNVVLINFWATWCGPCIAEIPEFNSLLKKYEEKNFKILGISVNDSEKQLKKFITKFNVDYPLLFGSIEKMNTVIINYGGFNSVPVSYLINREGLVVRGYPGAILGDYWTSVLENDIIKFLSDSIQFENNQ